MPTWSNWSNSLHYGGRLVEPRSVSEVQAAVKQASKVVVVGGGHSFIHPSGPVAPLIADSARKDDGLVVVDLKPHMNRVLSVDAEARTCTIEGGCMIGPLALELEKYGLALGNLPSLHVVTFIGVALTGTHGCNKGLGPITNLIRSMKVVGGDGVVREITDPRLFMHLGLLGVVVEVTIQCVPFYHIKQSCFEGVPFEAFREKSVEIIKSNSYTQFWVDFVGGPGDKGQVLGWVREPLEGVNPPTSELHPGVGGKLRTSGVVAAEAADWPIRGTGVGAWYDMLVFFRLGAALKRGDSVQAEYYVDISDLPAALTALSKIPKLEEVLQHGCEVRPVAPDVGALSPTNKRFGSELLMGLHFTMDVNPTRVVQAVKAIETALRPFNVRPHWGKLFNNSSEFLQKVYGPQAHPDCAFFWKTMLDWDPSGKFRNEYFDTAATSPATSKL